MADSPQTSQAEDSPPFPPLVTLRDGGRAHLRPITPQDQARVQEAFRRLSRESRFNRFFTPMEKLDGRLLERLTTADGHDHVVWAAMNEDDPDDPGMGAASFWRSSSDPGEAEFSITVADAHQDRGVGTLLLATLWILAREVGIDRFRLVALADNIPVIHWTESIGGRIDDQSEDLCELVIDLQEASRGQIPPTPRGDELASWLERLPALLVQSDSP